MYNYNLIISIFTIDKQLVDIMKDIVPLEHFNHEIKDYIKYDKDVINKSDIIIYDLDYNIEEILKIKDKKVIICTNNYKKEYKDVSAIISKPLNPDFVKYVITTSLREMALEEKIRFTESCLDATINTIPDMFWIKDLDGIHRILNNEFCEVVGKTKEDVTGKDHYYIWNVSKDDPNSGADLCKKTEDEVIEAGHTLRFTESVKKDNKTRQLITYKTPLYDKNGKVLGTVGIGHDVTDFKNMSIENEIILNSVPYAVLILDIDEKIQNINNYFETYFNITKEEIVGMDYQEWVKKTFHPERKINGNGIIEGVTYPIDGEERNVELRYDNIRDIFDNKTGKVCIFRDVTVERRLQAQIIQNSNVDFMTKLYNRRYLDKYISSVTNGSTLSLLSVDLDHFKAVNDTYGHKMGDEAIIMTADILNECFNKDLVVRMGGDEFLIVKEGNISIDNLAKESQNLLNTLSERFNEKKEFNKLSASIGIAQGILENESIDLLLQESDAALYDAKNKGRNCYCIYNDK